MAKVVPNHCDIDTRLQKGDRTTVTHRVRSHTAKSCCRVALCGKANVFLKDVSHTIPGERRALMVLEEDVVIAFHANDTTQSRSGLWPERTDSLFSALTQKPHLSRSIESQVAGAYRQGFADASPRVIEEQE